MGPVRPPGGAPEHHRKEYEEAGDPPPDYRITCIFVDKKHRRKGVTEFALHGAVDLIAQAGGGVVEGYPHDTGDGRKVSVLYNSTRGPLRASRLRVPPPQGQEELRDARGRAARYWMKRLMMFEVTRCAARFA